MLYLYAYFKYISDLLLFKINRALALIASVYCTVVNFGIRSSKAISTKSRMPKAKKPRVENARKSFDTSLYNLIKYKKSIFYGISITLLRHDKTVEYKGIFVS